MESSSQLAGSERQARRRTRLQHGTLAATLASAEGVEPCQYDG
jgi:hypothetical protein